MSLQGGFPLNRISELRVDYPSLKVVREHVSNGCTRMLVVSLPDNRKRTAHGVYKVAIDVMNGLDQVPVSYVLNIEDVQQRRFIIAGGTSGARYDQSQRTIPGTAKQAWWICHGNFSSVYSVLDSDPVVRIGGYLNHIISLLNG